MTEIKVSLGYIASPCLKKFKLIKRGRLCLKGFEARKERAKRQRCHTDLNLLLTGCGQW